MRAQDSKCWTCTHGLCVKETENELVEHNPEEEEQILGEQDDPYELFTEPSSSSSEPISTALTHTHVKAICFWRPTTTKESPPIVVSMVNDCNRYEKA